MSTPSPEAIKDAIPQISATWLQQQRWFSSKGRTVASISVPEWGALRIDQPGIFALALVRYTTGQPEQYQLPLIASTEAQPNGVRSAPATTIDHAGTTWYLHDAFQFTSFQRQLVEFMLNRDDLELQGGRIVFTPESSLHERPPALTDMRLVTAEQSNSSIIYDRTAILKGFRRVVPGLNPDVEVSRFLTTRAGFRHTPAMLGSISYVSAKDVEHSLGLLQAFAPNNGDVWEHTLDDLAQFLRDAQSSGVGDHDIGAATQRLAARQLAEIRELGALTGQMHVALASDPDDSDFAPRPLTPDQVAAWQRSIHEQSNAILQDLQERAPRLPNDQRDDVEQLLQARDRIAARIDQLTPLGNANIVTTRFHGDYHMGQVLNSEQGFLILDFEGEPLRSLEERRAHSSPLKDVSGMLRSLSYAANSALRSADPAAQPQLAAWTSAWEARARSAFLDGYRMATEGAPFVPQQSELRDTAIAVFELEKALYELKYELNNRPDWLPIPLRGIQRVV